MGIKHNYVSAIPDVNDPTKVRPSNWNDDHTIDGDVDFGGYDITNVGNPEDFGVSEFTALTDVPATYAGAGNKLVAVNAGATALEFIEPSAGGPVDEFTDLLDVPGSFSGESGKLVAVNTGETALEFIDASAAGTNLGWITPQDYYPNAGQPGFTSDVIDQADIDAHPEWLGTYKVNSYWSFVAVQEAIYNAYAYGASTPGNIVWNLSSYTNHVVYIPKGRYFLNHRLMLVAQNFEFKMAGRTAAELWYSGGRTITGDSHGTTTIDGIDATELSYIDENDGLFITGPGITEGTRVTAKASATSITLDLVTMTSEVDGQWYLWGACFICDSASYGVFDNLAMRCSDPMPRASRFDDNGVGAFNQSSEAALFVLDFNGGPGLRTQQLTFNNPVISGNFMAETGIAISPGGVGAAQGDTILFINPYVSQCLRSGMRISGGNALSIQIINGDFQNCLWKAIHVSAGSVYVNGTSFQIGQHDYHSGGAHGCVTNMGADCYVSGGGGPSSTSSFVNVRSEGSVGVINIGAPANVENFALSFTEANLGGTRNSNFSYDLGAWILGGDPFRFFMCVSRGGPDKWYFATVQGGGDTVTLTGASFTVNEWVGKRLYRRFGSSGFTQIEGLIDSNTANTVTLTGANISVSADTLFFIGGVTDASAPSSATFNVPPTALTAFEPVGVNQGYSTTKDSADVLASTFLAQFAVAGDWVVIPNADCVGARMEEEPNGFGSRRLPMITPLVAQVVTNNGFSAGVWSLTLNKPAKYTMTEQPGYRAAEANVVVDGDILWMPFQAYTFRGCGTLIKCVAQKITNCGSVIGLRSISGNNWLDIEPGTSPGGLSDDWRNMLSGQITYQLSSNMATTTPLDISPYLNEGNFTRLTPTQNMTLTADDVGMGALCQEWTLQITTSGVSSYNITFGAGFRSTGVLATGVVSAKHFIVRFITTDTELVEVSRTTAL